MKLDKSYLIIAISSLALLIVLIIQVNWILQTAKMKEELFNEKANMVLSKTADALSSDTVTRKNLEICVGRNEVRKIDSLFNYYMKFYNFHIGYYFEVKPGKVFADNRSVSTGSINDIFKPQQSGCYTQCLKDEPSNTGNGVELKLVFPEKEEFIVEEMGIPFISSVILILVVMIMFWRTTVSLIKEKEISEHTTDFLNNMTHEFKTPLTNIALAGRMIIKDSTIKQEDKIKHYSGIILEENEKLRLQVEQVLSMTALERGEIPLHKTELNFHQLVHDCLKHIGIQIENKQGSLTLKLEAQKFVVIGDKTHLTNALCNLIDNAIKYSPEKPELLIQTSDSLDSLIIEVSDKGIGIDKEYHAKVFDKFFRVPTGNLHDVKGFGLGLAYIKKIIEMHGGSIEITSEKSKGLSVEASAQAVTTFTVKLPHV